MTPPGYSPTPTRARRDRLFIWASLGALTLLAWAYLIHMAGMMAGPQAPQSAMGFHPWDRADFVMMLLMWVIMMAGMMVPTAIPMTLIYAAVARKAAGQGEALAGTWLFVGGYLLVWSLFSIAATLAQWALDRAALLSPMMVSNSPWLGALLLVAAGGYQWTPAKQACLRHCRTPAHFIAAHWKPGKWGALQMGWAHGLYCLGCCWLLMGLLFVGGVMNLAWILAITFFVLLEKMLPLGDRGGQVAGGVLILSGIGLALSSG